MADFYDWQKTLSYDADVTMVIGARGIGKTFGLRKQCVKDWLKDASRFVEIVRHKNELADVSDGYFNRIGELDDFKDLVFRTDSHYAYVAWRNDSNENGKPNWQIIGYFVAMTEAQKKKKKTFDHVRRILFDEAVIEKKDRYHTYLPNEFSILTNLVDTVSRERADTDCIKPRVYLLGNACDISNPYFGAYKVSTRLRFGYSWHAGKTFLLHYADAGEYAKEKLEGTVAGRMMANTNEGIVAARNEFITVNEEFVERKPSSATFMFGVVFNGCKLGVWVDLNQGLYHVSEKLPKNTKRPVYSLTRDDYSVNYVAAKRADPVIKSVSEMWYMGLIRYSTVDAKAKFNELLELFGVR